MSNRPPCALMEIPDLILDLYGLHIRVICELVSYDDRNILVELDQEKPVPAHIDSNTQRMFVVKLLNEEDSCHPEIVEIKNAMMIYLKKAGFPTPAPLSNKHHTFQSMVALGGGIQAKYLLRLLEFAPGKSMDKVRLTADLCRQTGKLAGRLDMILKDFPVDDFKGVEDMKVHWNLSEILTLRSKLHYVKDKEMLSLINEVLASFESRVLLAEETFSRGLIHGDMNDCNILVSPQRRLPLVDTIPHRDNDATTTDTTTNDTTDTTSPSPIESEYSVSGLIDFGDCTHSLYVFELAIAMCYVMISNDIDSVSAASALMTGYSEHMSLPSHDLLHLRLSVCVRMVQSFVYGLETGHTDDTNQYAQSHCHKFWPMLQKLWKQTDAEFLEQITTK